PRGSSHPRGRLVFVFEDTLALAEEQALLGLTTELDLALAPHRKARLAREVWVLVPLAHDELHDGALARRDAGLIAVATAHELRESPRELRLQRSQAHPARRLGDDAVALDLQLG